MAERPNKLKVATILLAAVAGLGGFCGFGFLGGLIASLAAGPLHISPMEGAQGYFAVAIGLMGGVLGFIVAVWIVLRWRGVRGLRVAVGGITALGILIAGAASVFGIWYSMQPHALNLHGPEPILRLEVRAPENVAPDVFADVTGELQTDRNGADLILDKSAEAARLMPRGYVPLYYRTSERLLALKFPDGAARLYNLRLPANPMPKKYHQWSAWQKPDYVNERGSTLFKRASGGADIEIRYHVETVDD